MTEKHTSAAHGGSDGLWRWLLGGLAAGGVVLGLLIAAYAVGYHRGKDRVAQPAQAAPAPVTTTAPGTTTTTTTAPTAGPVPTTAALVAQGKTLFASDGCVGCHSMTGAAGAGPSLKGAAGRAVELTNGQTVTADDAYLQRSITDPDAEIVKGYHGGIMSAAISSFGLSAKPTDVRALVAFIKSQK